MLTIAVLWYCFILAVYSTADTEGKQLYRPVTNWNPNIIPLYLKLNISDTSWQPVVRETLIPLDLESVPLQVKTDSTSSNSYFLSVILYDNTQDTYESFLEYRRWISINLLSTGITYNLQSCTNTASLPIQPSAEEPKIWTFSKTENSLTIGCNGVTLVTYTFTGEDCESLWKGDIVDKIAFWNNDKASKFFRGKLENCPGFSIPGSTVENWDAQPLGTTVTVQCKENHVLLGNGVTTCLESGEWSEATQIPECKKCSKYNNCFEKRIYINQDF
eukprot:sb/3468078/